MHLAAVLSISIGLLNLFPVPLLDGGHLLFYAVEAVRGRLKRAREHLREALSGPIGASRKGVVVFRMTETENGDD